MDEAHRGTRPDRPANLLLIVVDCLRSDRCPTAGPTHLKGWGRLRDGGTVFSQAISSASWTPVCFASLLTGEYSFVHGVRTIRGPAINPNLPTLATVLSGAGYSAHAFVTGPMLDVLGMNRGFDEYQHRPRDRFVYDDWGPQFLDRFDAIAAQDRPWFILLHLLELHCPRQTNGLPAREHSVREYDVSWSQLDEWIAALLDRTPPDTVTALTADHGESIVRRSDRSLVGHIYRKVRANLGRPRRAGDWRRHGYHVFDEVLRIPFAVAGPGIARGTVIDSQVRQIDIPPTLLDVLGCPGLAPAHGRSAAPLMRGEEMAEVPAYVETGCDDPLRDWRGLRSGGWKYAEHPRSGPGPEPDAMLFDLAGDPEERRNVIGRHPEIAARMREQIDELMRGAGTGEAGGQPISEEGQGKLAEHAKALGYM